MRTEEFDYQLPTNVIAQHPSEERAGSRLLVLHRQEGIVEHRAFAHIVDYLEENDTLVLNDSRVFPARLDAKKPTGGRLDILLVEKETGGGWTCLVKGLKKTPKELEITVGDVPARLRHDGSSWRINFDYDGDIFELLAREGKMPLPHYIRRNGGASHEGDVSRYQTVYAEKTGSIAAPTAGFHFTGDLLKEIADKGVRIVKVTLHIGIGTFLLIKSENVGDHRMHGEYYSVRREAYEELMGAHEKGRRIVACGTSAVRTLETMFSMNGGFSLEGRTELFIYPGYRFRAVNALITNFHLPRSTPLMLASAFAGKEALLAAYGEAIKMGYRFYSYGDAMLIL